MRRRFRVGAGLLRRQPVAGDQRARAAAAALRLLYQELEPGDQLYGVSLSALSGGQLVTYTLCAGDTEIDRAVYDGTRPDAVDRAVEALAEVFTDATVADPGGPG